MTCEDFRLAAMALADGEIPSIPGPDVETHLAACEACRRELEQLRETSLLWQGHGRDSYKVDFWPRVQGRLRRPERYWLCLLVIFLVVFKLADFVPDGSIGVGERCVPVLVTAAIFALLRQNPFQVKTKLVQEEKR